MQDSHVIEATSLIGPEDNHPFVLQQCFRKISHKNHRAGAAHHLEVRNRDELMEAYITMLYRSRKSGTSQGRSIRKTDFWPGSHNLITTNGYVVGARF
jgi:hypothetical protein